MPSPSSPPSSPPSPPPAPRSAADDRDAALVALVASTAASMSGMSLDTDPAASTAAASTSNARFTEPWLRRVRDVDDDTLAGLVSQLLGLRRVRNVVTAVCCAVGMFAFGQLQIGGLYAVLIYAILAAMVGMPVFAIGSLSVRRLFLREAAESGLSNAASMLVLVRAERRARFLSPAQSEEAKVQALLTAVRDPDTPS